MALARPIFLRLIGQYTSNETDAQRDDSRTNGAILIRSPVTGVLTRTVPTASNAFRIDRLFSYHPTRGPAEQVGPFWNNFPARRRW